MKKLVIAFLGLFLLISCNKKADLKTTEVETKTDSLKNKKFQMYEMSEMASLMEQMFAYNTQLKERILNNEDLGTYPVFFDKLHTAVLTDSSDRDAFFNDQAFKFIEAQQLIYEESTDTKKRFNEMVQQCLDCHSKKCGGPIPRIKKLLIP